MTCNVNRARSVLSSLMFVLCASAALTGCGGGGGGGGLPVSPATTPPPPGATNNAPTISGAALGSLAANTAYSFTPTANDADGDTLTFAIQNKPSWATFSTVNGQLTGTPTTAATHSNIVISASDGKASAALPAFTITVTAPPPAQPTSTTVSWAAPTQNTDGSALTNLAGFVVAYGTTSNALNQTVTIPNPSVDSYLFTQLTSGTYYFAVKAYTQSGAESSLSDVVSKVIP